MYRGQTTLLWQCGRRTASAGLPGLRMLHLIDEQQLETLAERRDGGEVLAGFTWGRLADFYGGEREVESD